MLDTWYGASYFAEGRIEVAMGVVGEYASRAPQAESEIEKRGGGGWLFNHSSVCPLGSGRRPDRFETRQT